MRWVSTRVLPEPAPATISSGPPSCMTAARCWGLRPSSRASASRRRRACGRAVARGVRQAPGRGGQGEVLEERRHGPSRSRRHARTSRSRPVAGPSWERARSGRAQRDEPCPGATRGLRELDEDRQPGGLQRRHGRPPGGRAAPQRSHSARKMPSRKPTNRPTTGIGEEPDDARRSRPRPAWTDGTPARSRCRPASRYLPMPAAR